MQAISDAEVISTRGNVAPSDAARPGNDIDALPDEGTNSVEHIVTGVLSTLGESFHDRVKVALWRVNNPRDLSDQEYLSEYLPQEFTLDRVAQDFGGGNYRAVVKVPRLDKETGLPVGNVTQIAKAPRFKIGGAPKDPSRLPAVINGQPSNMDGAIKVMMDGMQAMMERLATAMQQPPQKTTLEMARELAELKTLFAPPPMAPVPDPLATALSQLSLMEKIKTLINPPTSNVLPDNPSDNAMLMTLLQGVLPTLLAAAQKDKGITAPVMQLENSTAPKPDDASAPNVDSGEQVVTDTPAPAPGAQPSEDDPVGLMQQAQELMLKAYVASLVANARANNDIEPIAQEVYEKATDEMWEFLEAPDALDKLAAVNKDVKLFPGWFERLRVRLLEIDSEPDPAK